MTPDPTIETWLTSHNLTYTLVDLDLIDAKDSARNQARDVAIDDDLVATYADDMAAGDNFPPIVARKMSRTKRVVLIGGNHRHHAALKAKLTTLPCYLIEPIAPELALRLAIEDNRRHGKRCSTDEAVGHALHLMALGATQVDASRIAGVSQFVVTQRRAVAEADKRAAGLGVAGLSSLTLAARYQLSQVADDPVFAAAAQAAVDHQMTGQQAQAMRKEIAKARSERDRLRTVGEHADAAQDAHQQRGGYGGKSGGRQGPNTRIAALRACAQVQMLSPASVALACADQRQRTELRARIKETAQHLVDIDNALKR